MNDSFVFYRSYYEAIKELSVEDQSKLFIAICEYALDDKVPELDGIAKIIFTLIKPNIDGANKRYRASVENGKKGGRPPKKKPSENLDETQEKPNENLNYNYNYDLNDNDNDETMQEMSVCVPSSPKTKKSDEKKLLIEEFEKLWEIYPKKQGKANALKKYIEYRTAKDETYCTFEEVLSGIENYNREIKATKKSYQYIQMGSSWFNQRRWTDEYKPNQINDEFSNDYGGRRILT